jgi:exopolysaccharide production protein ExoQ
MRLLSNIIGKIEPILIVIALVGSEDTWVTQLDKANTQILYIIVPLLALLRWKRLLYVATRNIPLLILYAYTFSSFFWSAIPNRTMALLIAFIPRTILAVYLAAYYSPREFTYLLTWTFGLSNLLSSFLTRFNNSAWMGIYLHKNFLARMSAVGALLFITKAIDNSKQRLWFAFLAAYSILMLLLSEGKSSLVVFLLSASLLPLYWIVKRNYKFQTAVLTSSILVVSILTTWIAQNVEFIVVDLLGKSLALNGRTGLWSYLIERGLTRPWLGYGYYAFWAHPEERYDILVHTWYTFGGGTARTALYTGSGGHSHSGFIDLFLSLGIIGMILFAISFLNILGMLIKLIVKTKQMDYMWMLLFLVFMVPLNFTITGTLVSARHLFWIIYVAIGLMSALQLERLKRGYHAPSTTSSTTEQYALQGSFTKT